MRIIFGYLCGALISLIIFPVLFLISLLPETYRYRSKIFYKLSSLLARWYLYGFGVSINYRNSMDPGGSTILASGARKQGSSGSGGPVIYIANHTSALDIFILEVLADGKPHIWISKMGYSRVPILGYLLRRFHVLVDSSSPRQGARALGRLRILAREYKQSILLFPEGTRHTDGKIHDFHSGFALLARSLKYPVVPIYIKNADKILAKKSFRITTNSSLDLTIGPQFFYRDDQDDKIFIETVRNWFIEEQKK